MSLSGDYIVSLWQQVMFLLGPTMPPCQEFGCLRQFMALHKVNKHLLNKWMNDEWDNINISIFCISNVQKRRKDLKLGFWYVEHSWWALFEYVWWTSGHGAAGWFWFQWEVRGLARMLVLAFCVSEPCGERPGRLGRELRSWMISSSGWPWDNDLEIGTFHLLQGKPRYIKATITFVPCKFSGLGGSVMVSLVCTPMLLWWRADRAAFVRCHPRGIPRSWGCWGVRRLMFREGKWVSAPAMRGLENSIKVKYTHICYI